VDALATLGHNRASRPEFSMPSPPLPIARTVAEMRAQVAEWRRAGETVAMTPTMGALHDGHLSLVRLGKSRADRVVTSIFVNPTQFAPHEDFEAYPRDEARDAALLASEGCDLLFAPAVAEMYAAGFSTKITVDGVSAPLDGAARPGHFSGVATVVTKQLQVIRRLVADLNIPVEIVGAPIARAADGLALSSRNAYLTDAERVIAGKLNVILATAAQRLHTGVATDLVEAEGLAALAAAGFSPIDYFEVRGAEDLARPPHGPVRVFAAAFVGRTRLIDNMPV
jgi:pantoate--beta-alanine ligase